MAQDLTRRSFLMGAAVAGSVAALGIAGCAPQGGSTGSTEKVEAKTEEPKADAAEGAGPGEGGGPGGGPGGPGGPGGGNVEPVKFGGLSEDGRRIGYCGPGDWLGEAPVVADDEIVSEQTYDVVVLGGGHAGLMAACGAVDEGATVAVIEMQPWASYVDEENTSGTNLAGWYGEDVGHVNSQFLIDRGFGPFNTGEITAEFCLRAAGRVNPGLLRNYVQASGPMFDRYKEIYDSYEADRKKNDSAVYMKDTQVVIDGVPVEDEGTFDMSNMFEYPLCNTQAAWSGADATYPIKSGGYKTWPCNAQFYGYQGNNIEFVHKYIVKHTQENGADWFFETTGVVLTQNENGDVTGLIAKDKDGYKRFNAAKGVVLAAGDFVGDPAMCWALLNEGMEWGERSGATKDDWVMSGFRTGIAHKMGCWAGGMVEPSPRGWMAIGGGVSGPWGTTPMLMINSEGKRFCNEGAIPQLWAVCMRQPHGLAAWVSDAKWQETVGAAPLDHGAPNFGMDDYMDQLAADMAKVEVGNPEGTQVVSANLAERKMMKGTVFAANTIEELAGLLGYEGEAAKQFVATVEHYNELCNSADGDTDFGKDAAYMKAIDTPPFYGGTGSLSHGANPMMVTMSGLMTGEDQNVLATDWKPIKGLYAAGNCLGGRYGFAYSTPFAGNSVGMAMTHGWLAGKTVANL